MLNVGIILAGGMGKRLWPLSTPSRPKYLLDIGGQPLLTATIQRMNQVAERILIVTHHQHTSALLQLLTQSSHPKPITIIEEPQSNNTAPAIALATAYLQSHQPNSSVLCVPADHLIEPVETFATDIATMQAVLDSQPAIVTIGIRPTRAETGYGYIEAATNAVGGGWWVTKFHEKPDSTKAQHYYQAGNYYWNSGMFGFYTTTMWGELATHSPTITTALLGALESIFTPTTRDGIEVLAVNEPLGQVYRDIPSISIDYAIAEHSAKMAVIPAHFKWNDIGSWDEVALLPTPAPPLAVESTNNVVLGPQQVALCGVQDLIVVTHHNTVLICKRGSSQLVKKIVETLDNNPKSNVG